MAFWHRTRAPALPALPAAPAVARRVVQPGSLRDQWSVGAASPALVTSAILDANLGRPARLVDLAHALRQKWGHGHAVLQTRELGLAGVEFDVAPPPGANDREIEAAAALKRALAGIPSAPELNTHLLGESLLFGAATAELDWEAVDGRLVPVRSRNISSRRFGYRLDDGALLYDPSGTQNVSADGVDLLAEHPPGKFIQLARRVTGDVPVREGLARLFVWLAMAGTWATRDWWQLAEMSWKPTRIGTYKRSASTKDIDDLIALLEQMTSSGVGVHSEDVEIELQWPKGAGDEGGSSHKTLLDWLGAEWSKATLGQTLTTEAGTRGARALGQIHNLVRRDIRDADALALMFAYRRFVVGPYYAMNFGDSLRAGEFLFLTEDRQDVESFARAIATLRRAGLKIPASYVYDQTGIPAPADDDELLADDDDADE